MHEFRKDSQSFSKPKAYDPTLATRPTPQRERVLPQQIRAQDLGFDADTVLEEKNRDLSDQVEKLRAQAKELQDAIGGAKESESLATRKLQSFQQVNRSQSALMRAELQKFRRRLAHTQEVAKRLQKQTEWYQANNPVISLPVELQGLPKEDVDSDEASELAQYHERWENDVAQLAAQMQADLTNGGAVAGQAQSGDSQASRQRLVELEGATKRQEKEIEQMRRELMAQPKAANAPSNGYPGTEGAMAVMDCEALRQELEAKDKENKEQTGKLRKLAKAYKDVDTAKNDAEARLAVAIKSLEEAGAEAARPQAPQRAPISPELLGRIRSQLASERAQIAELRLSVTTGFQQQLPLLLQEALQQQMPRLEHMVQSGAEEWKSKYMLESDRRRKLHNQIQELKGNIRVYCRVRPLNEGESGSCISFPDVDEVQIKGDLGLKKAWQFNEIFNQDSTQAGVFAGIRDLVASMLDGYNVCIFAYGQTGSGKTYSMQGTSTDTGIYQRTFNELFKVAEDRKGFNVELKTSILEIYNEEIRDLLDDSGKKAKLQVKMGKEDNLTNHVPGLTKVPVSSAQDVDALLQQGQRNRQVATTDMNQHSSRSHLLVQIYATMKTAAGKQTSSVITLVDLAGSERLAKSGVTGDRAKEAICINKSLSALGDVINARATKSSHTPFRNSTLTHLLQDSLSGDSKTLMLLQINPCQDYVEESLCSLQFGARVNAVELSAGSKK